MSPKEFFRELFRSLKSGRLHRALKLFLVLLLIYLSLQVGRELLSYYLKQKERVFLSVNGLKWSFSLKKGELSLSFRSFELESGFLTASVEKGRLGVLLYDSLLHMKPHLSLVEASRVILILPSGKKEKGRSSFRPPPVRIDRLKLGYLLLRKGEFELYGRELLKNSRELSVGGIFGKFGNRFFYVFPFRGYMENGEIRIPFLTATYEDYYLGGSLSFGPEEGEFDGYLGGSGFKFSKITVKISGKKIRGEAEGKIRERKISISAAGKLEGEELIVSRLRLRSEGVELTGRGVLSARKLTLKGKVKGDFREKGFELRGITGSYTVSGPVRKPVGNLSLKVERFSSPVVELSQVGLRARVSKDMGELYFNSRKVSGKVEYDRGQLSGKLKFRDFAIDNLKPVSRFRQKYGMWIPSATVSGPASFRYSGELSYEGTFKVKKFFFRGFRARGSLKVSGNREQVAFRLSLKGDDGALAGEGEIDLRRRRLSSEFRGEELELSCLDFLRKTGLEGKLWGSGRVDGDLKNPAASFSFSSPEIYLFKVAIPEVEGKVNYRDFRLMVRAGSSQGLSLEELVYDLRDHRVQVKARVDDYPAEEVLKVVRGFGVKLPFEVSGRVTGISEIAVPLRSPRKARVSVSVSDFSGRFTYDELVDVRGNGRGEFDYMAGELGGRIEGEIEKGSFKDIPFRGGTYRVSLKGKEIDLFYNGLLLTGELNGLKSRGNVALLLDRNGIRGSVRLEGKLKREFGEVSGGIGAVFEGVFSNFTVKISGKVKVSSPYLEGEPGLKVVGALLEPSNRGNISVTGNGVELHILLFGQKGSVVGKVGKVVLVSPRAKVKVNLAFVNLEFPGLSGTVSVPTFTVKPYGFYRLYSPTGVYIKLNHGKVEISSFTLSYVDGWIEIKEPGIEPVRGRFEAELGVKGLVYLLKLNRIIPFSRGSIEVRGNFSYDRDLRYRADFSARGVTLRSRYILDKVHVIELDGEVKNGEVDRLNGELSIGDGNVLLNKSNHSIVAAISQVPVGQLNLWKSLLSGNLNYDMKRRALRGSVELSRTRLFFRKNPGKEVPETSRPEKLPVEVSVGVIFDEPVKIKGELFWIELLPSLKLSTVNGELVISGNFYATNGEIDYMGKKFRVIYGSGTIEDLERKKGRISILASTLGFSMYFSVTNPMYGLMALLVNLVWTMMFFIWEVLY